MDINLFRSLVTLVLLLLFLGVCAWAYSRNRRDDFQTLANLPLQDDAPDTKTSEKGHNE